MSLKQKTVSGLFWSFIDSFADVGMQFIVGIILARILSPREYGLIGMLTVFIAVSQSFIDSGFSNALIQKKKCSQDDYSTVFIFNLVISLFCYIILFVFSGYISAFYNEPILKPLIQVLGIGLVINSFGLIQRTILTKEINFKTQTKITIIASLGSGAVSLFLAIKGFGVWSLVALTLVRYGMTSLFLWIWSNWKPKLIFSQNSFKALFSFGSKILLSGLIDTIYKNIYYLIIGKFFSAKELGFYTRADHFKNWPSNYITTIIQRVTFPVLSTIQDDLPQLKEYYTKIIRASMLITFTLMLGMAAIARPMVIALIGEKWLPSVIYLQMLCFVGMFYPLHAINLNMLKVQGRSDLFLKLEIMKKSLAVPVIFIGIFWGIKVMIVGMMVNTIIAYYLNSYWSGRKIGYPMKEQIKDILPSFWLALILSIIVYLLGILLPFASHWILLLQIPAGAVIFFLFCETTRFKDYISLKELVIEKISEYKKNKSL